MDRVTGKVAQIKVRTAMARRDRMTYTELGKRLGVSPQCIRARILKKCMLIDEISEMADAMNYDLELNLIERETGVKI